MNFICQHCCELRVGGTYRVTSEEEGIRLLDMIVCDSCYRQAKRLGLRAEEVELHDQLDFRPFAKSAVGS
jgi:RNase P subunit RPR2